MKRGDVVIVDVAYVGAPGSKRRPALVVQNDTLNSAIRETIIAAITSNLSNAHQPDQLLIDVSTPDGAATGLSMNSVVRCNRLQTIPQSDVRHVIGTFSVALMDQLDACLKSALGIS